VEDVWDEDSAYLELLTNEVRLIYSLLTDHSVTWCLREKSDKAEEDDHLVF
jgi:hypothetical protein